MNPQSNTFDSLKLRPGQLMQVEFDDYAQTRERSMLVGYVKGRCIIISTPTSNGLPVQVKKNDAITIRLFVNQVNAACAFKTSILYVTAAPFPQLYLKMPDELVLGEVRKSVRAKVHIDTSVMLTVNGERKNFAGIIDDLSCDGARVDSSEMPAKVGENVDLVFSISVNAINRVLHISGTIRSLQHNEEQNRYYYGLQFHDIEEIDMIALHAFVLNELMTN